MKAAVSRFMVFFFILLLITLPSAVAQNDTGEDQESDEGCILTTFCVVSLFLLYMVYLSAKRKKEASERDKTGTQPGSPPRPQGYRYPISHRPYPTAKTPAYPPPQMPRKEDVKCNLCNSKNLRFFEEGYAKCNDCRHVFYMRKSYDRTKKR